MIHAPYCSFLADQPKGNVNWRRNRAARNGHPKRLAEFAHVDIEIGSNILDHLFSGLKDDAAADEVFDNYLSIRRVLEPHYRVHARARFLSVPAASAVANVPAVMASIQLAK